MNMKPVTGMVLQSGFEPEHLTVATLKIAMSTIPSLERMPW